MSLTLFNNRLTIVLKPLNRQSSYYLLACCVSLIALTQIDLLNVFTPETDIDTQTADLINLESNQSNLSNLTDLNNTTSSIAPNNNVTNLTSLLVISNPKIEEDVKPLKIKKLNTQESNKLKKVKYSSAEANLAREAAFVLATNNKNKNTDKKKIFRESEVDTPTEVRFNSKHEIFGITVSSTVIVHGIKVKEMNDSFLKSEIHLDIPKLEINFAILNNFTFDDVKSNQTASTKASNVN